MRVGTGGGVTVIEVYLRKPSSLTPALAAAGPSENTSTNRLPTLGGAEPTAGAGRRPSRSADGEGVDWRETQREKN